MRCTTLEARVSCPPASFAVRARTAGSRPATGRGAMPRVATRPRPPGRSPRARRPVVACVLQRGDQREGRLGALVEIGAVGAEPVVAAASRGIEHRAAASLSPRNQPTARSRCSPQTGRTRDPDGPSAGVRQRGGLDRLLIEARARRRRGPAPPTGYDREVAAVRLAGEKPLEQVAARRRPARSGPSAAPIADHRVGQHGVRVGEPRLGPRPISVRRGVADDRRPRRRAGRERGDARTRPRAPRRRRARRTPSLAATASVARRRARSSSPRSSAAIPRRSGPRPCRTPTGLRPQQSSTPWRSCQRPRSVMRLRILPSTPCASARKRKADRASERTEPSGSGSRVATTRSRAMSSVQ